MWLPGTSRSLIDEGMLEALAPLLCQTAGLSEDTPALSLRVSLLDDYENPAGRRARTFRVEYKYKTGSKSVAWNSSRVHHTEDDSASATPLQLPHPDTQEAKRLHEALASCLEREYPGAQVRRT